MPPLPDHDNAAAQVRLRPARPDDAPRIAALWNPWVTQTTVTFHPEARSDAEIAALIAARQAAGHGFWLAETAPDPQARSDAGAPSRLLGFASYAQFRQGPGYAKSMEHTIILAREAHGLGIGRKLMQRLEDHARNKGAHLMIGAVSGENSAGQAFHHALGYSRYGCLPGAGFKFGRLIDLWLFGKPL